MLRLSDLFCLQHVACCTLPAQLRAPVHDHSRRRRRRRDGRHSRRHHHRGRRHDIHLCQRLALMSARVRCRMSELWTLHVCCMSHGARCACRMQLRYPCLCLIPGRKANYKTRWRRRPVRVRRLLFRPTGMHVCLGQEKESGRTAFHLPIIMSYLDWPLSVGCVF
jgi:hypothetical protein